MCLLNLILIHLKHILLQYKSRQGKTSSNGKLCDLWLVVYDERFCVSKNVDVAKNLGFFARGIPIIGEFFGAVMLTVDLAADLKHGKLNKSVTIDSCPSCFIFWFDKREIALLSMNDVTTKSKNSNVKVAPPNSQPTPGVVTVSKSEIEWDVEE